jgi:hypothetical protein
MVAQSDDVDAYLLAGGSDQTVEKVSFPFAFLLTSTFFVFQLFAILHHELWRDELQPWMLARHSRSISQLITLKKYEGHPDGWFLIVYAITRVTANPLGMKLIHLLIATATVYVLARYSPFTRLQKTLLVFGYFLFFEYATISRNYALGVLFAFIFCAMFRPGPRKNYLLLAIPLALLCQTSVYGVMIAFSFTLVLLFEGIGSSESRRFIKANAWRVVCALIILLASVSLSALHMLPPQDGAMPQPSWVDHSLKSFARSLSLFWNSFVPIPRFSEHFWATNILWDANALHGHGALLFLVPLSIAICGVSILFFIRKPVVMWAYICGLGALILFKYLIHLGQVRHDGHAFILFLACLWLARAFPNERGLPPSLDRIANGFAPFQERVLLALFALHAAVGIGVNIAAFRVPFSEGKAVADFIRAGHMEQMPIVGHEDAPASTVAGFLDRDIYYLPEGRMGSYIVWDKKRVADNGKPAIEVASAEAVRRREEVLVILSYRAETLPPNAKELASFEHSMSGDYYYLYLAEPLGK